MKEKKIKNFGFVSRKLGLPLSEINKLSQAINGTGGVIKIIGGNVRDLLEKKKISSATDLTVNLPIEKVLNCLRKNKINFFKTGMKYGSITVKLGQILLDVTSLRKDISTNGRWAETSFTNDWLEDASRRDFTINSIYCDLNGELYDPFNGIDDLKKKKVVFIGEAEDRIHEDYLRILRFFRFSIKYSSSFDTLSFKACKKLIFNLRKLSFERKFLELSKIIILNGFDSKIVKICNSGLLDELLEEKTNFKNIKKFFNAEKKLNIIDVERRLKFLILRSKSTLIRRYPQKFKKKSLKRMKSQINFLNYKKETVSKKLYYFSRVEVTDQLVFDYTNGKISFLALENLLNFVNKNNLAKRPFSGNDLIKIGLKDGYLIGRYIQKVEEWWVKNDFKPNKKECLVYLKKVLPRN